jgi:mannose-1-phosphate guanylyltransferase
MIVPVILAGGSGTRLWPLSRQTYPKQFLRLTGERSLLQETVLRSQSINSNEAPIIVCNQDHYFLCLDQLKEINQAKHSFVIEPVARNSAPAIVAAALEALKTKGDDAVLVVMPSDHHIDDLPNFKQTIDTAVSAAKNGYLVTLGVTPTSPETGYGYIKTSSEITSNIFQVETFTEKPNKEIAEQFLKAGDYFWNSGIFIFKADCFLKEIKQYAPDILEAVTTSFTTGLQRDNYIRLNEDIFSTCRNESIDYAVMEQTKQAVMVPLTTAWNDLGCWNSVAKANNKDDNDNVVIGDVVTQNTESCYLHSEGKQLSTLGLKDHIIVNTKDSVLVAHKDYSQQVKELVNTLKTNNSPLVHSHTKVFRPWGYYEGLISLENFLVKHIRVNPGEKLSLQMHNHRSEHWIVVSGVATVTCADKRFTLTEGESTFIPIKTKHCLENETDEPMYIVEVQCGDYIGEDDIIRFEDRYGRVTS